MKRVIAALFAGMALFLPAAGAQAGAAGAGGVGNDAMYGTRYHDYLSGGLGQDVIFGRAGNDLIRGGAGSDSIWGGRGFDVCYVEPRDIFSGCEIAK